MPLRLVVGQRGSVDDYAYEAVRSLTRGETRIILYAVGENECKLVQVFLRISELVPGTLEIVRADIGSRRVKGERRSYLEIEVAYTPPSTS